MKVTKTSKKGEKMKVGQSYQDNKTGRVIKVLQRATGNNHWIIKAGKGNTHHIHEGTIRKYYTLIK